MPVFRFYYPVEVRYGDLDPQGHVNNARHLTYLEQARLAYLRHLGLWTVGSFENLGIILAELQITYRKPILFGQPVRVGVAVTRLGNKSLEMVHSIEDAADGSVLATCSSVLVTYDYASQQTVAISEAWRHSIQDFEQRSFTKKGSL